jgi:preprotein translocase SecF subunit
MDVVSKRHINFLISAWLLIVSLLWFLLLPLNYWIDISGWTQTEYSYESKIEIEKIQEIAKKSAQEIDSSEKVINSTSAYEISGESAFIVEAWFTRDLDAQSLEEYKINLRDTITSELQSYNSSIVFSKYINIWASFWDYIKDTAKITLIIAIIWITLYVAYAFSWAVSGISPFSFGLVTIITLFHDVIISSGFYIFSSALFPEFKIDTFFVTALLTILGYSINDTIVVSDRIRANLKLYWWKKKKLDEIINISVNETITRSVYTSVTLLFVLFSILIFWPESIAWFTLVMIFGTLVWTYSSIFIASPLIYEINKKNKLEVYKKKEKKPEDLIVV